MGPHEYGIILALLSVCCTCLSQEVDRFSSSEEITLFNQCMSDAECVQGGKCWNPKALNHSICLCSRSCRNSVPVFCDKTKHCNDGFLDGLNYCSKENKNSCLCPSSALDTCTKKDLKIHFFNLSAEIPYLGADISLTCCINIDPRLVLIKWHHNGTDAKRGGTIKSHFNRCWSWNITNIQYKDSGKYTCSVSLPEANVQDSKVLHIQVRAPIIVLLNVSVINETALFAKWTANREPSVGVTLHVRTLESRFGSQHMEFKNLFENSKIIGDLKPATWYNVTVEVETLPLVDNGPSFDSDYKQTAESKPDPPVTISMKSVSQDMNPKDTRCLLTWRPPEEPNGQILCYEVEFTGLVRWRPTFSDVLFVPDKPRTLTCIEKDQQSRKINHSCIKSSEPIIRCQFDDVKPNRNYTASIKAINKAGESEPANFSNECITPYSAPDSIPTPSAKLGKDNRTLVIDVLTPDEYNGPISCYYLAIVPFRLNRSASFSHQLFRDRLPALMIFEDYGKTLEFALSLDDNEPIAYIAESFTTLGSGKITIGDGLNSGPKCATDYYRRHPTFDGPLVKGLAYTGFLVVRVDSDADLSSGLFMSERRRRSAVFTDYAYSNFINPPVFLHNGLPPNPGGTPVEQEVLSPLAKQVFIPLVVIIILLALLLVGVYFARYKQLHIACFERKFLRHRRDSAELSPFLSDKSFPPILADDLPSEYLKRHKDSEFLFRDEFESLPQNKFDTIASDRPENSHKNRYNDIKAYDVTRVKLQLVNDDSLTDYINANFVQGYKGRKLFIAAQGPKEDTVGDFWRMVFEHNVELVVMVTNLQEKYRNMCHKYWPESGTQVYNSLQIEPIEYFNYADYSVRKIRLSKLPLTANGNVPLPHDDGASASDPLNPSPKCHGNSRIILQYHYTGWYDYRAPDCTVGLLRFICRLRKLEKYSNSLIVVHCSAGVGRTGTFIAIDAMLDQMAEEGRVDIFGFVSGMRRERNFMVQSLEQYVFVYKALAEWYLFGETDVDAEKFMDYVHYLRRNAVGSSQDDETNMKRDFLKLDLTLEDQRSADFANKDFSSSKNRSEAHVPFDRNRVILQPISSAYCTDTTYINASVVQGYSRPYILAQDPLPNTIADFWRMIWEHDVATIVMLSSEEEMSSNETYWPEASGKGLLFGDRDTLGIQLVQVEESPSCITRKMNLTNNKEKSVREVQQFSYRDWPPQPPHCLSALEDHSLIPRRTASFLDLIGKVQQRQNSIAASGPIIVHCENGSTRSGLYCAVSLLLERVKAEGRIDVFQVVKTLRAQRPHVLENLAQYEFCYQCVLDYLEPFR